MPHTRPPITLEGLKWRLSSNIVETDDIEVARRARAMLLQKRTCESGLTLGEREHHFTFGKLEGGSRLLEVVNKVILVFTGVPPRFMVRVGLGESEVLEGSFTSYQEVKEYCRGVTKTFSIRPFLD